MYFLRVKQETHFGVQSGFISSDRQFTYKQKLAGSFEMYEIALLLAAFDAQGKKFESIEIVSAACEAEKIGSNETKAVDSMANIPQVAKFEVGKTYSTRSIGDHNCIYGVTVASRTKSTVTTTDGKTFRIAKKETAWNEAETIFPEGRYSKAPSIKAS